MIVEFRAHNGAATRELGSTPRRLACVTDLEIRVALGPTSALLLTWADADDRVDVVRAARHHLCAFNRGAWEQAERHRFWQPGTTPRDIEDKRSLAPISAELFRGYDPKTSARLDAALAWYTRRVLDQQASSDDRAVVNRLDRTSRRGIAGRTRPARRRARRRFCSVPPVATVLHRSGRPDHHSFAGSGSASR